MQKILDMVPLLSFAKSSTITENPIAFQFYSLVISRSAHGPVLQWLALLWAFLLSIFFWLITLTDPQLFK
jgi:hypothetical protein